MNILVLGANGNIGTRVVSLLLENDHQVVGFVHGESHLPNHDRLKIITGDVRNSKDVQEALDGIDIVISTLGSWGTKSKDILSTGMQTVIPAMEKAGVKRIISLTGSGVLLSTDSISWYDKLNPLLLKVVAPKILTDGEKHIQELSKSSLDWTVVRSPVMKNSPYTKYALSNTPSLPWKRASRESVTHALVDIVTNTDHVKEAPFLT